METDRDHSIEKLKEAELEQALELWEGMRHVDKAKGWKRLTTVMAKKQRTQQLRRRLKYISTAAAVVILLLTIGKEEWFGNKTQTDPHVVTTVENNQPRLILEDGQQILLDGESAAHPVAQNHNFTIDHQGKNIIYTPDEPAKDNILQYNTLEIPRGAEYELILSDGTHVWLNADTRLRYPVKFGSSERRVYLEGEAYFQVAKNTELPFRVESPSQTVEVLGTQFNVYAYSGEEKEYTTLEEGRIAVTVSESGQKLELRPGQQLTVNCQDGNATVSEVDITQVTDWKSGMFVFDDQSLEMILRKVARWYNIEVLYKNTAAKSIVFKGNLPRYGELEELLRVLESSSKVHFSLQGKSLVVE